MGRGAAVGSLPPDFVHLVRERTDIVDLIGERVALRPAGREWVGLCPFHEERTPSFSVSREKQAYFCHGCHKGGDAIGFVMEAQGLPFADAVAELAARAGLQLPETRALTPEERRRLAERQELLAACEAAAVYFERTLRGPLGGPAIDFLKQRAVDAATAERFRIGYAPPQWDGLLQALGGRFPAAALERAGLVVRRGAGQGADRRSDQPVGGAGVYDRFRGRVIFPICDDRGRIIAFGGRTLDPREPAKYLNSPEGELFHKRRCLYGWHLARPAAGRLGRVVVVEGYMDAVTCHRLGFPETVASLGTSLSDEQAGMLARLAESVLLAYDADAAGGAATLRGLTVLQSRGARVEVCSLPEGRDPDDWLRAAGAEPFAEAMRRAEPLVRYVVRTAVRQAGGSAALTPERRWSVVTRVLPHLAPMTEAVRSEEVEWVARELMLRPDAVDRALAGLAKKGDEHRNGWRWNASAATVGRGGGTGRRHSGADAAEEIVLAALLRSSKVLRAAGTVVSIHDFRVAAHQALAERLLAVAEAAAAFEASGRGEEGGSWAADGPLSGEDGSGAMERAPGEHLLDEELLPDERSLIVRLLSREVPGDPERVVADCLQTMHRARRDAEVRLLRAEQRRLAEAGQGLQSPEMRDLIARLTALTGQAAAAGQPRDR